jgi:hypothetical protein
MVIKMSLNIDVFYAFGDLGKTRCTRAEWKEALLKEWDKVIIKGHCRRLIAKHIGAGVYEISLSPDMGW